MNHVVCIVVDLLVDFYFSFNWLHNIINQGPCDILVLSLWVIYAGKALEEVRASLFNKFRTLGCTKRQQQPQLWGPSVALTFNFLVSVSIILMNKLVSLIIFLLFLIHVYDDFSCFLLFLTVCSTMIYLGTCQSWIQLSNFPKFYSLHM